MEKWLILELWPEIYKVSLEHPAVPKGKDRKERSKEGRKKGRKGGRKERQSPIMEVSQKDILFVC